MQLLRYCIILSCLLTIITCSNVKNLTSQTFNQTIANNKYVMVKFYAPWCGHCKSMAPEYQKLAQQTQKEGINVVVGEVDATEEVDVAQRYNVQGYPSMKFFVDGEMVHYGGARTSEAMFNWIKRVTQIDQKKVDQQQIKELQGKKNFAVYYGQNPQTQKLIKLLNIIDPTVTYYISSSSTQQEKINLYLKNKQPVTYPPTQQISIQQIKQWVMLNTLPAIIPLSTKQRLQYVFYDKPTEKDAALLLKQDDLSDEMFKRLQEVCQANKDRLKCSLVDDSMDIYLGVKNYVRSQGQSVLVLTKDSLKQAYKYSSPLQYLTNQSWQSFLQQIHQNKLPNLAAIQSDQLSYKHAKILTDQNFTKFINDNEMVLVEFVSPGCAECVAFNDQFDSLAKKVYEGEIEGLEVVAIDLKKNRETGYELKVMQFPSFRLYLSGAFVHFQGKPQNKAQLLQFVTNITNIKPIRVNYIDKVPTPSVVLYDPEQLSKLRFLPAIFTRYQVYHFKTGNQTKIVLKTEEYEDKTYPNYKKLTVSEISKWLYKESDPVLVNLLMTNMEGKLKDALQNQVHLLGFVDVESQLSQQLKKTLKSYCKKSDLVCGYAKKGKDHFNDLMAWAGIDKDISSSNIFYVDTEKFQKFLFDKNINDLTVESIQKFVKDAKGGKLKTTQQSTQTKQASKVQMETEKVNKQQQQTQEQNPQNKERNEEL